MNVPLSVCWRYSAASCRDESAILGHEILRSLGLTVSSFIWGSSLAEATLSSIEERAGCGAAPTTSSIAFPPASSSACAPAAATKSSAAACNDIEPRVDESL